MALQNIKNHLRVVRLNKGVLKTDQIELVARATAPTTALSNGRMYYDSNLGGLYAYINAAWVNLGTGGAGGITSWDGLYDNDKTLEIDDGVLTFEVKTPTNGLYLNKSNVGAGVPLVIANAGSGYDMSGPFWSIISTGSVATLELTSGGKINVTGGALTIGKTLTATTFLGTATIAEGLTVSAGGGSVSSVANDAPSFSVLNGTITTYEGVMKITAGEMTTGRGLLATFAKMTTGIGISVVAGATTDGSLLRLTATDATLTATGRYIQCYSGAANIFSVGRYGATVIAGNAATNVFTITTGDVVLSDASITLIDADDAATLSVTNNTATTASVFVLAGSGVFTGNTTSSFLTITPSGLTSGTAVYLPTAALTTGKALHIVANAITTGNLIHATSSSAAIAAGELATIALITSGSSIAAKTGALVSIASSRTELAANATADNYNAVSIIRTNITATSGTMTAAGSALYVGVVNTQTAGTLTATLNGIEINYPAIGTGNALKITDAHATTKAAVLITASGATSSGSLTVTNAALTEGTALKINAVQATLTTGKYIQCHNGAADSFSVGKHGATIIAGNGIGTAALTLTAGDFVVTSGYIKVSAGGVQCAAVARTATADGTTTGTVAAGTTYVTVTAGGDANSIIILPTPTPGNIVWLYVGATGYELRSSAPDTIAINGGAGAGAESAIAASVLVRMTCTSATTWVGTQFAANGTESAVQVAAA